MEDKYSNALQGVKDSEGVGKVNIVEGQVEEAEDPGRPQEEYK